MRNHPVARATGVPMEPRSRVSTYTGIGTGPSLQVSQQFGEHYTANTKVRRLRTTCDRIFPDGDDGRKGTITLEQWREMTAT